MTQFKLINKREVEETYVENGISVIKTTRSLTFESILAPPLNNYRFVVYPTTAEEYDPLDVNDVFTFTLTPVV